jgi:hypothetical protein
VYQNVNCCQIKQYAGNENLVKKYWNLTMLVIKGGFMRRKKLPRGTNKDYTKGIDIDPEIDQPDKMPEKFHHTKSDGVGEDVPSIDLLATRLAPAETGTKNKKGQALLKIESNWDKCLKAAKNGYEFQTIAKSIGVSERSFTYYLSKNPAKKQEIVNAKLAPRDLCVQVILKAAKSGQWLPAAWWLERTCWQEFARPEVKLQLMDRVMNQNEVVQTFNGKSLQQINEELRKDHGENPKFQRALESGSVEVDENGSQLDSGKSADFSTEGGSD